MFAARKTDGAATAAANYIEDVFSTYLYTGTGAAQTITNDIDLDGEGGMVWLKGRSGAADHALYDTTRGATFDLVSNSTAAQTTQTTGLTSFNGNGFSIGALAKLNTNAATYTSWTFREQAKFFDVVTWSGDGVLGRQISHALGSVPGAIIVKNLTYSGASAASRAAWNVYHRSVPTGFLNLNETSALNTADMPSKFGDGTNVIAPTDTVFTVGSDYSVNRSGDQYVAYLFAHDAGGFGLTGTDNVISCGSYTGNGSATGPTVTLGYEPQWILIKRSSTTGSGWVLHDTMRGLPTGGNSQYLQANTSDAEAGTANYVDVNATGFQLKTTGVSWNASGDTYIYIAIRRGPMKTPTSGTSVFYPLAIPQADSLDTSTVPFPPDLVNTFSRNGTNRTATYHLFQFLDRLRGLGVPSTTYVGGSAQLVSSGTAAEVSATNSAYVNLLADSQNITRSTGWDSSAYGNWINYFWRRAPGFFDVVCYTGTGDNRTVTHNLGVVPELIIIKNRTTNDNWAVYAGDNTDYLLLNLTSATADSNAYWNDTSPTSTVFTVGTTSQVNELTKNYVAYLFASINGVSKIGSYTGNGSSQTINCGFAAGARFILIKRTSATGDWYVWDTARGIVSGNDPRLSLNSTAVEVTTDDSVDADSSGFIVNQLSATNINVNAATYIYLAIA